MPKLTLTDIESGYASVAALNANFTAIETALENTLSRDGTTPNQVEADIDMNGKSLLNMSSFDATSISTNTLTIGGDIVVPTDLAVSALPVQTGFAGGVLTTDGTNTSWEAPEAGSTAYNLNMTGSVVTTVADKLAEKVSVKDFGAVGDGVTDDTVAIQAAIDSFGSGGVLATSNGGTLYFPKGLYAISAGLLIQQTGVRLIGEGIESTKILVTSNLGAAKAVFEFDQTNSAYSAVGVGIENLRINMQGYTGHGVWMKKPYDGVTIHDVYIDNVGDAYNGFRIEPDSGVSDVVSQTVLMLNCIGIHKNNTATAPLFYCDSLQEAVFSGCKAFGTYEANGKAACHPFEFIDCRGIVLEGCSAAFASKHGFHIQVVTRPSSGFLISNPTLETIDGAVKAEGLVSIGEVINLQIINPRVEGAVANASGAIDLDRVYRSTIYANGLTVVLDAACIRNIVYTEDYTEITDGGDATTVIGHANQADDSYYINADGFKVYSAGTAQIESDVTFVKLYSSGSNTIQADYPFADTEVGVLTLVNRSSVVTQSRVTIGATDSGGTGFRVLRVPN